MDQKEALHKLLESADLVGMLEDLLRPERISELSPASWAGMRITLRSLRDLLMSSHTELSRGVVKSAIIETNGHRKSESSRMPRTSIERSTSSVDDAILASDQDQSKNLKSALERFVER